MVISEHTVPVIWRRCILENSLRELYIFGYMISIRKRKYIQDQELFDNVTL